MIGELAGALLPAKELGCGSPTTCWRRSAEGSATGVFDARTATSPPAALMLVRMPFARRLASHTSDTSVLRHSMRAQTGTNAGRTA